MVRSNQPVYRYQAGGTLRENAPYVYRHADEALYRQLMEREFCYVFNCRQMGKSSLRAKTMRRLMAEDIACVSVDLTTIGTQTTTEQWYADLIDAIHDNVTVLLETGQLANFSQSELDNWHQQYEALRQESGVSPVRRCNRYFKEVLLSHLQEQTIVIFIDEIDAVLNLEFDASDFFALIRASFNQRADDPDYERLTFALFGVATPAQLIRDGHKTPFNLGKDVVLTGFEFDRSLILAEGLVNIVLDPEAVLREILTWTGGQPFLTQKICDLIQRNIIELPPQVIGEEAAWVEELVRSRIIDNWESQDQPQHLKTIYNRLTLNENRIGRLLGLYQDVLQKGEISTNDYEAQADLCLSGLVVLQQGKLRVYNKIYAEVFNQQWIDSEFLRLRPPFYADALKVWEQAGFRKNEQYLLTGETLEAALQWEKDRKLSDIDYQFLRACQEYAAHQQIEANRILDNAHRRARAEIKETGRNLKKARRAFFAGVIVFIICVSILVFSKNQAQQAEQKSQMAEQKSQMAGLDARSAISLSRAAVSPQTALKEILDNVDKYAKQDKVWYEKSEVSRYPIKTLSLALQKIVDKPVFSDELVTYQEGITTLELLDNGERSSFLTAGKDGSLVKWSIKQSEKGRLTTLREATFTYGNTSINSIRVGRDQLAISNDGDQGGEALILPKTVLNASTKKLIDLSSQTKIHLWDRSVKDPKDLSKKLAHEHGVYSIRIAEGKDKVIITGGTNDGLLKFWNLQQVQGDLHDQWVNLAWRQKAHVLGNGKPGGIRNINFNHEFDQPQKPDKIITAGIDGTAKVWDLNGILKCTLNHYEVLNNKQAQWVNSASFILDKLKGGEAIERAVTGGDDGIIKIWNLETCKVLESINTGLDGVGIVKFNPKKAMKEFAVSSRSNGSHGEGSPVRIWSRSGKLIEDFRGHEGIVQTLRYGKDEKEIITAGQDDGKVLFWDIASLASTPEVIQENKPLYSIRFSNDQKLVATAGQGRVTLWEFDGKVEDFVESPRTYLKSDFEKKFDAKFRTVRFIQCKVDCKIDPPFVVAASDDGTVRFWDKSGVRMNPFPVGETKQKLDIESIDFSRNADRLAIVGNNGLFQVRKIEWDKSSGSPGLGDIESQLSSENDQLIGVRLRAVRWSEDQKKVAAVGDKGIIIVWSVDDQKYAIYSLSKSVKNSSGHNTDEVSLYSVSADDQNRNLLTIAGANGIVYTFNLQNQQAKEIFPTQSSIRNISFSKDEKLIATVGSGGSLSLWDESGSQVADLEGHRGIVRSVSFARLDGKQWIFSAGDDGIPRAWPVRSVSDLLKQACKKISDHDACSLVAQQKL